MGKSACNECCTKVCSWRAQLADGVSASRTDSVTKRFLRSSGVREVCKLEVLADSGLYCPLACGATTRCNGRSTRNEKQCCTALSSRLVQLSPQRRAHNAVVNQKQRASVTVQCKRTATVRLGTSIQCIARSVRNRSRTNCLHNSSAKRLEKRRKRRQCEFVASFSTTWYDYFTPQIQVQLPLVSG